MVELAHDLAQDPRAANVSGDRDFLECGAVMIEKPIAREYVTSPAGVATVPNIPNWAWHEYGMRVGFWRLLESFEKRKLVEKEIKEAQSELKKARSEQKSLADKVESSPLEHESTDELVYDAFSMTFSGGNQFLADPVHFTTRQFGVTECAYSGSLSGNS